MKNPESSRKGPQTPERKQPKMVYDFGWARGTAGLATMLESLDEHGFELVCVTHVTADSYRVFFRRSRE